MSRLVAAPKAGFHRTKDGAASTSRLRVAPRFVAATGERSSVIAPRNPPHTIARADHAEDFYPSYAFKRKARVRG
jgi:hypothetical protein